MKRTTNLLFSLLLSIAFLFNAQAQKSDYQIKQNFKEQYTALNEALKQTNESDTADSLIQEIHNLEDEFRPHSELITHAFYPETFSGLITELESHAVSQKERLLIIENQSEQLEMLASDAKYFKNEISLLNQKADSLRNEIMQSQKSEKRLAGLVEDYRKNMQKRDRFILDVVDSLLVAYKDLEPETVRELSRKMNEGEIATDQNPLNIINNIIDRNIEILKSSGDNFTTEDYLRMYTVQNRFEKAWKQIGDGLVRIYGEDKSSKWENTIETKMKKWKASASYNMWESLDNHLEQNNLDLSAFDNNYSFFVALDNFVNTATKNSQENVITKENYEKFQQFNDFWNSKIKDDWSKFVQEGEVLTMNQISSIDQKMITWRDEAKPRSFLIPALLGVSLIAIVGLTIVIFRREKPKDKTES